MNDSWWVNEAQLDPEQRSVYALAPDKSHLIIGPPGSGKTNLLLLRAKFLYLARHTNLQVISFTRALKDYIVSGGGHYAFPSDKVTTYNKWQRDFCLEHGIPLAQRSDFAQQRRETLDAILAHRNKWGSTQYDAILLDEAQDYLPSEIYLFRDLAKVLVCTADDSQRIYHDEDSMSALKDAVNEVCTLKYHYRNSAKICRVADATHKHGRKTEPTCNHDDSETPSSVELHQCGSVSEQASLIVEKLADQLEAYPNELLGVMCPTQATTQEIWRHIESSRLAPHALLQLGADRDAFVPDKSIVVCTCHSAKGLEFRAVHMAMCDKFRDVAMNRNVIYTSITRAKTSLDIYYCEFIHGYFESAIHSLQPLPDLPGPSQVFGVD